MTGESAFSALHCLRHTNSTVSLKIALKPWSRAAWTRPPSKQREREKKKRDHDTTNNLTSHCTTQLNPGQENPPLDAAGMHVNNENPVWTNECQDHRNKCSHGHAYAPKTPSTLLGRVFPNLGKWDFLPLNHKNTQKGRLSRKRKGSSSKYSHKLSVKHHFWCNTEGTLSFLSYYIVPQRILVSNMTKISYDEVIAQVIPMNQRLLLDL